MTPALWLCADLAHAPADDLVQRVCATLHRVPAVVWLRVPRGYAAREVVAVVGRITDAVRTGGGRVIVGDRLDLALSSGADGVHLPERSFTPAEVRTLARSVGRTLWISAAVHDAGAMTTDADVLVLSPFGDVPGKGVPLGASRFAMLRALAPEKRVIALGGIRSPEDVRAAVRAGADGVAVRGAFLSSHDPATTCEALHRALTTPDESANPRDPR